MTHEGTSPMTDLATLDDAPALPPSLALFLDGEEAPEFLRTTAQVDAYLAGLDTAQDDADEIVVDGVSVPVWEITDNATAEWAMRRVKRHTIELADIEQQANEAIDRIRRWQTVASAAPQRRIEWLTGRLQAYAARLIEDQLDAGIKKPNVTLHLPSGDVPSRKSSARFVIVDEDRYLASATDKKLEHLVRRPDPKPPYAADMKDLFGIHERPTDDGTETVVVDKATGEVVEGVSYDPGGQRTYRVVPHIDEPTSGVSA